MSTAPTAKPEVPLPVSSEWLETTINKSIRAPAKLLSTKCNVISGGDGKGYMSTVTAADLNWDEHGSSHPSSIVIKIPTTQYLQQINSTGAFEELANENVLTEYHNRECTAYELLTKYEAAPPIPLAKCYYLEKRDAEHSGMIILDNLSSVAKSTHINNDMSYDKVKVIAEHVACVQAYGFRHPEILAQAPPLKTDPYEKILPTLPAVIKQIRERHPERLRLSEEQLESTLDEVQRNFKRFQALDTTLFTPVICLGDTQPNNILWKTDAQGNVTNEVAAFLDLQIFHASHCLFDLGFQLVTFMDREERRRGMDSILSAYLKTLAEKCGSNDKITPGEVKALTRKILLQTGLVILTFVGVVREMVENGAVREGRELDFLDRSVAALEDAWNMK